MSTRRILQEQNLPRSRMENNFLSLVQREKQHFKQVFSHPMANVIHSLFPTGIRVSGVWRHTSHLLKFSLPSLNLISVLRGLRKRFAKGHTMVQGFLHRSMIQEFCVVLCLDDYTALLQYLAT